MFDIELGAVAMFEPESARVLQGQVLELSRGPGVEPESSGPWNEVVLPEKALHSKKGRITYLYLPIISKFDVD